MDDKQNKLLIGAIALLVLAGGVWFFFGLKGARSGVADLPKPTQTKREAPRQPVQPGGGQLSTD